MKKIRLLLTGLLLTLSCMIYAQDITVKGTVTDATTGEPVSFASVIVKGTSKGVNTLNDGSFSIKAPMNGTLVFSFIGYQTQEIAINDKAIINVGLDSQVLDEVVVVGYTTTTKKSFTGTATKVNEDNIVAKSTADISKALQGEVAGVQVVNTSGQPGTTATIHIRGIGSVNGNTSPLYILDGIPYNGDIAAISPADIATTTVLKDAAATAIYGSRGANGVIVLTTKKGSAGHSQIEINAKYGVNMSYLPRYSTISDPDEYVEISWDALRQQGVTIGEEDPLSYASSNLFNDRIGINTKYNFYDTEGSSVIDSNTGRIAANVGHLYEPEDWEDEAFQNSSRREINLKISGGEGSTHYYTSFGFLDDDGFSINSDYRRYTGRVNVTHQVRTWLKGSMNLGYNYSETNSGGQSSDSGSIFWFVDNIPSIYPLYLRNSDGSKVEDDIYGGYQYDYGSGRGFGALTNAVADAQYNMKRDQTHGLDGNSYLEASFLKYFKLSSRFGLNYYNDSYDNRDNPFYGSSASQNGSIYKVKAEMFSFTWTNMLSFNKSFGLHNISAFIAHENTSYKYKYMNGYKTNLVDPFGNEFNNAVVSNPSNSYINDYYLESFFGQVNYDYNNKYFASLTIRRDGSSRFLNDKWGTFGALGLGWSMSDENFMKNVSWVNRLKLKASYGIIGEQGGVGYYPGYDLYEITNINDEPALSFDVKGNPDLSWESSKMFQTGIEFSLFNNVLEGTLDFYEKNTDDLLFDRRVGPSLGYALLKVNDGQLRNTGFEFDLTGHIIKTKDLSFDVSVNGEMVKNQMITMPLDPSTGEKKIIDVESPYGYSTGHSLYDFYIREYAGVDAQTGEGMWNLYYNDLNNNGTYDDASDVSISSMKEYISNHPDANVQKTTTKTYSEATQKYVGKDAIPKIRGAFRLSARYKQISISAQFLYSLGGYAYDYTYANLMDNSKVGANNWSTDIRDRWEYPGDVTDIPRLNSNYDTNVNSISTRFLTKSDYLTLNNLRVAYDLSQRLTKHLGIQGISVYVSGDNLMSLTKRDGFYPSTSTSGSSSTYRYSPLTTITAGLKLQF